MKNKLLVMYNYHFVKCILKKSIPLPLFDTSELALFQPELLYCIYHSPKNADRNVLGSTTTGISMQQHQNITAVSLKFYLIVTGFKFPLVNSAFHCGRNNHLCLISNSSNFHSRQMSSDVPAASGKYDTHHT